ncbi:MAG: GGDEF domain-containing protein [Burkholderiales bacterium]
MNILRNRRSNNGLAASPIATLEVVWFLSVLVFLLSYTFEVLKFNQLYSAQIFLLPLLQITLSIWACIEVHLIAQAQAAIPLRSIRLTLFLQLLVGITRYPFEYLLNANPAYGESVSHILESGLAAVFVPAYLVIFLIISRLIIAAFSYVDQQRTKLLESEVKERLRFEKELIEAQEKVEAANRALLIANAELNQLATTDPLTGTWNRRRFEEALKQEVDLANRYARPLSLLMFDIDHFKLVNDHHGHQAGDEVLVELARLVRHHTRSIDSLARWGGEEFLILIPQCSENEALNLAEKLRILIERHLLIGIDRITASFGIATYRLGENMDSWLSRVDHALYKAKAQGRNRSVCAE